MSRASVSIRIERQRAGRARGQRRHDLRQGRVPGYVDQDRTRRNSVLIEPLTPARLRERANALYQRRRGRAPQRRRDQTLAWGGIVTWSRSAQGLIDALPRERQDALYQDIAQAVAQHMGVELTGLVVHRDESAPHAHLQMLPRRLDTGLMIDPGRGDLSRLQDIAAAVCQRHGLAITRGKPRRVRQAAGEPAHRWVHRSVRELHADLPREIRARQRQARQTAATAAEAGRVRCELERLLEETRRKLARARADESATRAVVERLEARARRYERRIGAAEQRLSDLDLERRHKEQELEQLEQLDRQLRARLEHDSRPWRLWDAMIRAGVDPAAELRELERPAATPGPGPSPGP